MNKKAPRSSDDTGLPTSWTMQEAGDVCVKIQDGTHFSPKVQLRNGKYMYVTAKNVRPAGLDLSDVTYLREEDHRAIYGRCDARLGDVLLVKDGVNAGDAALNTISSEVSLLSSVCFLRPVEGLLRSSYLRYYLQSPQAARALTGSLSGTAIRRIVLKKVRELPVVVAPLAEQARIVAEIEKQFTRLDAAVAALEAVQAKLKRGRASVLKAAVEGRLMPTEAELARAEGRSYEAAPVLLERILDERRRRWPKGKKYRPPADPEAERLARLPEGWGWATAEMLYFDAGYGTSQKCTHVPDGPPVIRIPNVQNQALSLDDLKYAAGTAKLRSDGVLRPGDFLFIRTNGSRSLIGRGAIVLQELPRDFHFASYLIRLRLVPVGSMPRWLALAWHTRAVRDQLLRDAVSSAGQHNVSLSAAARYLIPLPPDAEQQRIVTEVERRLSVLDALDHAVEQNLARCGRLRHSILKRAFNGKLVPQDPADEPASELLARIRAQRAAEATA